MCINYDSGWAWIYSFMIDCAVVPPPAGFVEGISTYIQNVIRIDALYPSLQLHTKPELYLQLSLFFNYILSCF